MKATLEQVAEDALNLPAEDRIALTRGLIQAMHPRTTPEGMWGRPPVCRFWETLSPRIPSPLGELPHVCRYWF
jgi:hypothetical protein